jgi:hypothetical protein
MRERGKLKIVLAIIILAAVVLLLIWAFTRGPKQLAPQSQPPNEASRVSTPAEENVIVVNRLAQERNGIVAAPLETIVHRESLQAYGVVLRLTALADLRKSYVLAKAQAEDAIAKADVSKKEYERLKALNEDNKNVSDKDLQSSEANWHSAEINLRASQEVLPALKGTAQQEWGEVISRWLFEGSPAFYRLIQQEDFLLQITLPLSAHVSPAPGTISVQTPDGALVSVRFVSPSPQTDPRIQGISFFYLAPARGTNLLPGMNVAASMPAGPQVSGFFIPESAIVWWQGKAWVYKQKGEEQFVRQRVTTKTPAKDGYFVMKGFKRGERIVVKEAQLLLSEEFRTKTQTGEEDED